ncbi:uncharacterized protein LOC141711338 [Apium graveolens]|uniref:uncharacterized protein LOC141711338 n=1 Tax=Apium graveolens TaxID=4045 RepID=UPI003D7B2714
MSFIAWNCHGLAQPRAVRFLQEINKQIRPSVIFFSETLVKRNKIEKVCKSLGFGEFYSVDAQGHGGGELALFWKSAGSVVIKSSTQNYIDFEVFNEQVGRWSYTGFYGYPERCRRAESWNLIKELSHRSDLPWCIAGDFNDMVSSDEKRGGRPHPRPLLEGFNQVLLDCGLADLGFVGGKYTWERFRGSAKWVQERLDRGLANKSWNELFPVAEVKVLEISTSDHLMLCISLNRQVYRPREQRFRFENVWIKDSECRNIVQECWNRDSDIVEKMVRCCAKLEEWGGGLIKEIRTQMEICHRDLKRYRSRRDHEGVLSYNKARWEFLRLLEKHEIYWKQRAKQFWLREGDKNSRFFINLRPPGGSIID